MLRLPPLRVAVPRLDAPRELAARSVLGLRAPLNAESREVLGRL
jgi:hypothetical protein